MPFAYHLNPAVQPTLLDAPPTREPQSFHAKLPGYAPTPLVPAPALAARLGVGQVWVKDESSRLGLPAFKILGASWAVYCALAARLGGEIGPWDTPAALRARLAPLGHLTLVAATDGNHGRAVARMAALLGYAAHILVPAGTAPARIAAIAGEGAAVTVVDGSYDDAVARSAEEASPTRLVISDTSWPGYEDIPRRVIDGYSTILWEVDDALARSGAAPPDLVLVQMGVGAFASAVTRHYRRPASGAAPRLVGVEPDTAACVLASLRAGALTEVPGPHPSIMAGLNCGLPSLIAWPALRAGLDAAVAIPDDAARAAMRDLAAAGIVAGETGAAGLGGLVALLTGLGAAARRAQLGITGATRVLLFSTEGATDPAAYAAIVGHPPAADSQ
jgi:diaminopropionate ammonia-lyase